MPKKSSAKKPKSKQESPDVEQKKPTPIVKEPRNEIDEIFSGKKRKTPEKESPDVEEEKPTPAVKKSTNEIDEIFAGKKKKKKPKQEQPEKGIEGVNSKVKNKKRINFLFFFLLWWRKTMFEESMSIPSIWASMNSWFTPAVLFLLLNLMIGTIFVTSGLGTQRPHQQPRDSSQDPQPQLPRSPSVLQRLKSINFYSYRSQEPTTVTPSIAEKLPEQDTRFALRHTHQPEPEPELEREPEPESHEGESPKTLDEIYGQIQGRPFERTKSDQEPASGETPVRLSKKMKKSASAKSTFAHFEEGDIVESRRPATVREGKAKATVAEGDEDDEEVDAKADDFINKFKQQLKLQRLDSIIRYKEMIGRGTGK